MLARLLGDLADGGGLGEVGDLAEVVHLGSTREVDAAFVEFDLAGEGFQEGGLALAVSSDEGYFLTGVYAEGDVLKNEVAAEGFGRVCDREEHRIRLPAA